MTSKLEAYKRESLEFNRQKLIKSVEENMEFHEWMERNKLAGGSDEISGKMVEPAELVRLGEQGGITHPFACRSSPYFNSLAKDVMIEIKNPTEEHRPFASLKDLTLLDLNENKETS